MILSERNQYQVKQNISSPYHTSYCWPFVKERQALCLSVSSHVSFLSSFPSPIFWKLTDWPGAGLVSAYDP